MSELCTTLDQCPVLFSSFIRFATISLFVMRAFECLGANNIDRAA